MFINEHKSKPEFYSVSNIKGKWNLKDFKEAFYSKKRNRCAPPAPACGLYLNDIKY